MSTLLAYRDIEYYSKKTSAQDFTRRWHSCSRVASSN